MECVSCLQASTSGDECSRTCCVGAPLHRTRQHSTAPGGFEVNSVRVHGSVMCFPEMWSLWRPRRLADVTPESLAALEVLTPAPEVLVVGCGRAPGMLPPATMSFLRSRGIAVELVDSVRWGLGGWEGEGEQVRARAGASARCCARPPPAETPVLLIASDSRFPAAKRRRILQRPERGGPRGRGRAAAAQPRRK